MNKTEFDKMYADGFCFWMEDDATVHQEGHEVYAAALKRVWENGRFERSDAIYHEDQGDGEFWVWDKYRYFVILWASFPGGSAIYLAPIPKPCDVCGAKPGQKHNDAQHAASGEQTKWVQQDNSERWAVAISHPHEMEMVAGPFRTMAEAEAVTGDDNHVIMRLSVFEPSVVTHKWKHGKWRRRYVATD